MISEPGKVIRCIMYFTLVHYMKPKSPAVMRSMLSGRASIKLRKTLQMLAIYFMYMLYLRVFLTTGFKVKINLIQFTTPALPLQFYDIHRLIFAVFQRAQMSIPRIPF